MSDESKYRRLGVDPSKESVRKIFSKYINNDYPNAFVNIVRDPENDSAVFTMHMDGDGSKFVQRALHYFETMDESIFQGAVDDAISMNTGDVAASGFVDGTWIITDVINVNGKILPKDVIMRQIALRLSELFDLYRKEGFGMIYFLGGETADLPTQVKSAVFDVAIYAKTDKSNIISGDVAVGDRIFGFASNGKASWENNENSGMMSNGITLARVELMDKSYSQKYPFLSGDAGAEYRGRYLVGDKPEILKDMTVSEAILSPTRQWAILIKRIIDKLKEKDILHMIHGISLNTGGGATKIGHVGSGILYKKKMPVPPPVFELIQKESGELWEGMFESFNCGVGIDVVGEDDPKFEEALREVSASTSIELFDLGRCESSQDGEKNKVELETLYGFFKY